MSDTLEWILRLVDRVSGPAHGVVRSLNEMTAASKTLGSIGSYGVDMLSNAVGMLVTTAQLGAVALGSLLLYGAKMALDAASFRDDMLRAFELITGTRSAALATYQAIQAISDKTPFRTNDVMGIFKTLLASGFDQKSAETMFAAMSDVAAVQGKAGTEKLQEFSALISKLIATDKMTSRELMQLTSAGAQAGVGAKQFLEQVMKAHDVTRDAAIKMVEHGALSGSESIQLLVKAVQENVDKGKALGTATVLFGQQSLAGAMSTFHSRIDEMFQYVDIEPVKRTFTWLNQQLALGSRSGEVMRMAMNELFGSINANGESVVKQLFSAENVDKFLEAVRWAKSNTSDFIDEMKRGWTELQPQIARIGEMFGLVFGTTNQSAGTTFADILFTIAEVAIYVVAAILGIVHEIHMLERAFNFLGGMIFVTLESIVAIFGTSLNLLLMPFALIIDLFTGFGMNLTAGLWNGIKKGWATLLADFHDLLMLLPEGVKKALNIASPSRVMFALGAYTAEGFGEGLRSRPNDFGANALSEPTSAASGGGAMVGGGNTYAIEINVNASGSMSDDAADGLAVRIRREVAALFDGLATQAGAPAEVTP